MIVHIVWKDGSSSEYTLITNHTLKEVHEKIRGDSDYLLLSGSELTIINLKETREVTISDD